MAGSPTHPVMPNLIMLWKMSPPWGEGRAGARLWARGPLRPRTPFIGTQAGPLLAGLDEGPLAGRLRHLPLASKSEIQPRHNLHSRLSWLYVVTRLDL
jgi:hypothetical protein